MQLGDRIKEFRSSKQMKQSELADKAKISRVAVGNYERNERQPTAEILQKIASALNVQPNDLLGWDELEQKISSETAFVSYLKSIGYSCFEEPGEIISSHLEDVIDENGCIIGQTKVIDEQKCGYTLAKGNIITEFNQEEFAAFQAKIQESIDYLIWQKNKKEPPSAATENGSNG